jgi:hypothetical protein
MPIGQSDMTAMDLDCLFHEAQLECNLLVQSAGNDVTQDFGFPAGQCS